MYIVYHVHGCPFLDRCNGKTQLPPIHDAGHRRLREDNLKGHRSVSSVERASAYCPRPPGHAATISPSAAPTSFSDRSHPTGDPSSLPTGEPTERHQSQQQQLPPPQCSKVSLRHSTTEELCNIMSSVQEQFTTLIESSDTKLKSRIFGASLRLCFHDAGEVLVNDPNDRLGMDGCLNTQNGDNAGLVELEEEVNTFIEPIWQDHCDKISRADFWAMWGKFVIEASADIAVSVDLYTGRFDNAECALGAGRLPMASGIGLGEIQRVFVDQMGLTLEDAVTLIGAHTVGHMSTSFSGFGHPPDDPRADVVDFNAWDLTSWVLDNAFFRALLGAEWTMFEGPNGAQAFSASPTMPLMMLNTDLSLAFDLVEVNGVPQMPRCGGPNTCDRQPSTLSTVNAYASDNDLFVQEFAKRFTKMCNVGYSYDTGQEQFTGKFGTLSKLVCA